MHTIDRLLWAVVIVLACVGAGTAFAGDIALPKANAAALAGSASLSNADASAKAAAGALSLSGSLSGSGAQNNLTINEAAIPTHTIVQQDGGYKVENVPNVVTPNIYPTTSCAHTTSIGGSVAGFGIGGGSSWTDKECRKQEVARQFHAMGMKEDALAVMCSIEEAAAAPSCQKAAQQPAKKAAAYVEPQNPFIRDGDRSRGRDGNLVFDSEGRPWKQQTNGEWIQTKL